MSNIEIQSDVYLERLTLEHLTEKYVAWLNDESVVQYTEQRFLPQNRQTVEKFISQSLADTTCEVFALVAHGQHVGNFKLSDINANHASATVSFLIGEKAFWGKGLATMALKRLVKYAHEPLQLKKLNASLYSNNLSSMRVFEKCEFVIEGIRRNDRKYFDRRIDLILVGRSIP